MNKEIKEILNEIGYYQHIHENLTLSPKELDILVDYIINLQESEAYYYGQYKDYKSRNKKAVSILKDLKYIDKYKFAWDREFNKALNILNGGDENED